MIKKWVDDDGLHSSQILLVGHCLLVFMWRRGNTSESDFGDCLLAFRY